jgi:hypothetical protein
VMVVKKGGAWPALAPVCSPVSHVDLAVDYPSSLRSAPQFRERCCSLRGRCADGLVRSTLHIAYAKANAQRARIAGGHENEAKRSIGASAL